MPDTHHDARLDQLLTVAARVFADKGFHPSTMRDLARASGFSLAGMYHYVDSKETILFLIQRRCFSRVLAGAESALRSVTDPLERLQVFIRHHVTYFARHRPETKVLSHEAGSLGPSRAEEIRALKRRYLDALVRLIGAVQAGEAGDARLAAYALFGMMNWTYTWYDPDGPVAPEALADRFAEWFVHGIAPRVPRPVALEAS